MLHDGLIDELHLCTYPLTRGSPTRIFPEGLEKKFALAKCESYANGVIYLNYRAQA